MTTKIRTEITRIENEVSTQADLISQIQTALEALPSGGGGGGTETCTVTCNATASGWGGEMPATYINELGEFVSVNENFMGENAFNFEVIKNSIFIVEGYQSSAFTMPDDVIWTTSRSGILMFIYVTSDIEFSLSC